MIGRLLVLKSFDWLVANFQGPGPLSRLSYELSTTGSLNSPLIKPLLKLKTSGLGSAMQKLPSPNDHSGTDFTLDIRSARLICF